jgi:hypothetical protein
VLAVASRARRLDYVVMMAGPSGAWPGRPARCEPTRGLSRRGAPLAQSPLQQPTESRVVLDEPIDVEEHSVPAEEPQLALGHRIWAERLHVPRLDQRIRFESPCRLLSRPTRLVFPARARETGRVTAFRNG